MPLSSTFQRRFTDIGDDDDYDRIEDDQTAGSRGATPQSITTEPQPQPTPPRTGAITGSPYDSAFMHFNDPARYPLEQQISSDKNEYNRLVAPPPPMSLLQRIAGVVGNVATAGRGEQAMEQAATLRDRAAARKQQERESLGTRIGENTRSLAGTAAREEGETLRARLAAQAQVAAAQRLGETIAGQNQRTAATNATREDIAGKNIESREGMLADRIASQEKEAAANRQVRLEIDQRDNAVKREIAAMRVAAANSPDKVSPQINRQAQTAMTIIPQIDRITQETYDAAQQLGPAIGRWNDFWTGKVGAPNPQFANYMADVGYLQSAITIAHSQGRVSNLIFEHFQRMYDAGRQSPENMIEFLKAGKTWMEAYRDAPQQIRQGGMGGNNPPPPKQRITLDQLKQEKRQPGF